MVMWEQRQMARQTATARPSLKAIARLGHVTKACDRACDNTLPV